MADSACHSCQSHPLGAMHIETSAHLHRIWLTQRVVLVKDHPLEACSTQGSPIDGGDGAHGQVWYMGT
eukprot:1160451-Pelagomonas_calceolata.AAC.16